MTVKNSHPPKKPREVEELDNYCAREGVQSSLVGDCFLCLLFYPSLYFFMYFNLPSAHLRHPITILNFFNKPTLIPKMLKSQKKKRSAGRQRRVESLVCRSLCRQVPERSASHFGPEVDVVTPPNQTRRARREDVVGNS